MKEVGISVVYPGLADHPQHELLNSMANKGYGFGGLLCVDMESEEKANRLMDHLQNSSQFGLIAVSLGYYETLMSCSGSSTSSELDDMEKAEAGISPGLVRMSIGYTGTLEQKWSQFEKAITGMRESTLFNKC
ncbi:methionine gamma-lyase [Hibiscus trionum]|uniref:Methionine gamma-lyase n=1 Tax=Hibiscus trionum TaxID=183268 RepID=A0A9W7IGC1_HIBTR|nr:methionine gamma-lyase [Hibiscus trionum]